MQNKKLNGISVRQAITLDYIKDLILLGGEKGLDRTILSINVMEVPDILPWVKEGQLLLTTGFSIKDDFIAQNKLVPELSKHNLAGLVIKPKRYIDKVPQEMIDAANANNFPLFEMPQHLSHPIILEILYGELVSRQTIILRRTIDAHNKLMKVALENGGIPAVCETLYQISENPVFVAGEDGQIMWRHPLNIASHFEKALSGLLRKGKGFFSSSMTKEYLYLEEKKISIVQYPINIAGKWHGTIIIAQLNRELQEIDYIATEQASTVVALTFINDKAVRQVEQRYKNDFLFDWLEGKLSSEIELIERGGLIGYELRYSFVLIAISINSYNKLWRGDAKSKSQIQYLQVQLRKSIELVVSRFCNYFIVGERGERHILLLKTENGSTYEENMELAKKIICEVLKFFNKQTNHSFVAGIGRYRTSLVDIPQSYEEASQAILIQRLLDKTSSVLRFDDLGVFRLLDKDNVEEASNIVNEFFDPLMQHDRETNSQLIETLRTFFRCNGNVNQTSKQIFAHYNTVLYRLKKIEEVTGLNIEDSEDRFNLQLALKLGDAFSKKPTTN